MPEAPTFAIKATNITLTADVVGAVEKRFATLTKFVSKRNPDQETRFQVEVGRKNKGKSKADDLYFVELDVISSGERHRAVAQARRLEDAIDEAKAEMTAHLSREHARAKDAARRGGRAAKEATHRGSEAPLPILPEAKVTPKPRKAPKKKEAKKAPTKRVSPRSRKHGTKNTRGAGNRPPRMLPPNKAATPKR